MRTVHSPAQAIRICIGSSLRQESLPNNVLKMDGLIYAAPEIFHFIRRYVLNVGRTTIESPQKIINYLPVIFVFDISLGVRIR